MMYKKHVDDNSTLNELSQEIRDMDITQNASNNVLDALDAALAQAGLSEDQTSAEAEAAPAEEYTLEPDASTDPEVIAAAEVEDVLADLDLDDMALEDLDLSGAEVEVSEVLADDQMRELEQHLERQEAYQEQTAAAVVTVEKQPAGAAKVKTPRSGSARGSSVPRAARDLNTVAEEFFVLSGDAKGMDASQLTAAKTATIARKPSQVKIAEKFDNLFTAVASGKLPSVYTMIGFRLLDANKKITSGDLIAALKTELTNCGEGTARSQCGQLMNLFAAVGIADRSGNTLELRSDSLLAERIRELEKPAASVSAAA
jgi:hypothetical protein